MKVRLRYTITQEMDEDSANWDSKPETPEALLALVKEHVKEEPSYVFEGLDQFTINVEIVN